MEHQPESTRLLYAQLLSQCAQAAAPSGRGISFVAKRIKGRKHWYLQLTVGSRKTQHYVGPDTTEVRRLMAQERGLWDSALPDLTSREQMVSMLAEGGSYTAGSVDARLFELLERAGVFLAGGVLVGSHAFVLYGNMLGVRWELETTRTQDVDTAAERHLVIGLPNADMDLRRAMIDSELGFIEVPALDRRSASTKFRIRGRQLSVDMLTPMPDRSSGEPVYLQSLKLHATPVRFLDYLLGGAQAAVVAANAGVLVKVPAPARYALHKLVLAERRVAAFQTRTRKDLQQAEQLLEVLIRDRPGDLRRAWSAAQAQPRTFMQQLRAGLGRLSTETASALKGVIRRKIGSGGRI